MSKHFPRFTTLLLIFILSFQISAADFQLNNRTFHLPEGFTIEIIAGPPVVNRPITADFDELGRLYVSDSSGSVAPVQKQLAEKPHRILRLEDTHGDGHFDKQTVFADKVMFPEGTLWHNGSLYVAAPPSIWKLTDTNGDGVADQRGEWFEGKTLTGCANDLHGPYLGPDGWIYWCKGAFAKQTYTLPNGKPFNTRAAHIFRSRPDGTGIEPVMTGGMDNPVEIAFTPGGERIFTTTFLQNPAAGHRDGLIHAVYGGVYGKVHDVIDDHIRTGPDLMPVLAHLGPAASRGLTRYESEIFGPQYRDNLFSTSFNLHKVFRHVLTPEGATFACKTEDFLTSDSLDFHPTHLIEDADGSLIVVDTGGWYKLCCPTSQIGKPDVLGAIYRVRRTDAKKIDDPRGVKIDWAKATADELAALLADPRLAVQKRAIAALAAAANSSSPSDAKHKTEVLRSIDQVLAKSTSARSRLSAVWAACRSSGPDSRASIRAALKDNDETVAQAACHAVSIDRDRFAASDLLDLLEHPSLQVRRAAAEALGRTGNADTAMAMLGKIDKIANAKMFDRVLEHSLTYALIELGSNNSLDNQVLAIVTDKTKHPIARRIALIALDQTANPLLASLPKSTPRKRGEAIIIPLGGDDANDAVSEITRLVGSPDAELSDAALWVTSRHPEWGEFLGAEYRDLLESRNLRLDSPKLRKLFAAMSKSPAVQNIFLQVVADTKVAANNRIILLETVANSSPKDMPAKWMQTLTHLLADSNWKVASAAVDVINKLSIKNPPQEMIDALLKLAAQPDMVTPARLNALNALPPATAKNASQIQPLPNSIFEFVVGHFRPDTFVPLRLRAAEVLGRSKLSPEQLNNITGLIALTSPLELDRILPAFAQETADDAVAAKLLDSLEKSKSLASLRMDTLRTATKHFSDPIHQRVEALATRLTPDAAKNKAKLDELLANQKDGDIRRGQLVFNSTKAACASCHTIGYVGGKVGPDLTRIGAIRAERDLLESIVFPSSSFVQSYEPVIVETTDNDTKSGILRKNDNEEVILVTGPDQETRIPRKEIKSMRPGQLSVMPAGLDQQLTPQDLIDLVTFLKACK